MKASNAPWGYLIVWEFQVRLGSEMQFEKVYGPKGTWAEFFKQAEGYLGTELNRDWKKPGRYLTLDFWQSQDMYERFRDQHRSEYKALDTRCQQMTESEVEIGGFARIEP
ncbi:MAG TPA: antibiotic biosynthesis monooxygenase [Terriglobales bacterium]|nr:antibiotic biosynthesis monooxygenase [Terriglobales bacterium]